MANTLDELYQKYINRVSGALEKDRYFQYLFAMAQAGHTTLQQRNKVLHKVVDEAWLSIVEKSLDSLYSITANPRRYVASKEEVVPVALAKKITAESVRHLSQNTQFISKVQGDEIQPSRVLNVTTEDSYDLYENRFIYHLIQRLVAFIDKRTDLIFWATADETMDTMVMETTVEDAYETIEYKLEMKVKNRQSPAEAEQDNMQVFMRIDRVRRRVMALRSGAFYSLLSGCAHVRSPIQRTNLMMKDPDYRTCYQLWQFLESYDSIGYTIREEDRALSFDEEYYIQLQTSMIANYAIFKSILQGDARDLSKIPPKRQRVLQPRFLKRIDEQIVDNADMEDVEIRKVFVQEVTQAQLDAEEKLAQSEEALRGALQQLNEAKNAARVAAEECAQAVRTAEIAQAAREQAETSLARTVRSSRESVMNAEKARVAAQQEAAAAQESREMMQQERDAALAARVEAEALRVEAEKERNAAEKQMLADRTVREEAQQTALFAERTRRAAEQEARTQRAAALQWKNRAEAALAEHGRMDSRAQEMEKAAREARALQQEAQQRHAQEQARTRELDAALQQLQTQYAQSEQDFAQEKSRAEAALQKETQLRRDAADAHERTAKMQAELQLAQRAQETTLQEKQTLATQLAQAQQALQQERAAREAAEALAQANTLGQRWAATLRNRRNRAQRKP